MNNTFNENNQQNNQNNYRGKYNNSNTNYQENYINNNQQDYNDSYNPEYQNNMNNEYEAQQQYYPNTDYNYGDENSQNNYTDGAYDGQQQYYQNMDYDNEYNTSYQNDNATEQQNSIPNEYDNNQYNSQNEQYYENYQDNDGNGMYPNEQDEYVQDNRQNQYNYNNNRYEQSYGNNVGIDQHYQDNSYNDSYQDNMNNVEGYFQEQQGYQDESIGYGYVNNQVKDEVPFSKGNVSKKKKKSGKTKETNTTDNIEFEGTIAPMVLRIKAYLYDKVFFLIPIALFYMAMLNDRLMDTFDTMMNYDIDISNIYYLIGPVLSFIAIYELIYFVYYVVITNFFQGQTFGKKLCHLTIISVDPDNDGLSIGVLFKREFVSKLLSSILFIGYLCSLFSKSGVAIHDRSSKTRVVIEEE